jgi:hypothetical protein
MEQALALKQHLDEAERLGLQDLDMPEGISWKLKKVHRGFIRVAVPTDVSSNALLKCRGIALMPPEISTLSIEELLYCAVQLRSTWDETLKVWNVLWHNENHTLQVALMQFVAPWPTVPRRTLVCVRVTHRSPSEIVVTVRTISPELMPDKVPVISDDSAVHADLQYWVLRIRRHPNNLGWEVGVVMSFDAKGSIPNWLLSTAGGTYPTILSDLWKLLVRRKKESQSAGMTNQSSTLQEIDTSSQNEISVPVPKEFNQTLQKTALLCAASFLLISSKFVILLLVVACWVLLPEGAKSELLKVLREGKDIVVKNVCGSTLVEESVWNGGRLEGLFLGTLTVLFMGGLVKVIFGFKLWACIGMGLVLSVFPDSSHSVMEEDEHLWLVGSSQ